MMAILMPLQGLQSTNRYVPNHPRRLLCKFPHSSWVATRRGLHKPVSSSPPFSTGRATFIASGATPEVLLHVEHEASVSISAASTDIHPCLIPFHQPSLAVGRGNSLRVRFVLRTSPG